MTAIQRFHYEWPPGVEPILFSDWIAKLPENEKTEWLAGKNNQHRMRQEAIDRGDMIMIDGGYVWKDKETAIKGKGIDQNWEKYWQRWQSETGVKFSTTIEEV